MSDRRSGPYRDERRRERENERNGERRRRSRSPAGRSRGYNEQNSYQSSRNYREREREDRYRGNGNSGGRDWDRDRDRGSRRDARRDGDDDRRRDFRRDRDFDDRRRRDDGRDGGGDRERDKARDRDDMRQMERQSRQKEASPPPKPRQKTPDLTPYPSILEKKRRLNQWDVKPPGYENVTAEQAKLSGMFPLPGAPRAQPMDQSRLQAFMNQPGNQVSEDALKPSTARQAKRLFVHNLPASATSRSLADFFNLQLNGLNITTANDPCISANINEKNGVALAEFKTQIDATNAMALNGIEMDASAMDTNGDSNGASKGLQIRRPKDYIVSAVTDESQNDALGVSSTVPDTQNKLSMVNIPSYIDDKQISELLMAFGELRSLILARDTSSQQSRGIAFFEYKNPAVTDEALNSLNGMELGDANLKVTKASIGIQQVGGEMSVNAMSMMASTQAKDEATSGRVVCFLNMISSEELMDPDEADEIVEDVKEGCEKYGPVIDIKMPRPAGARDNSGVGKVYVKFETPAQAQAALTGLSGRKFADRTVVASFYGEEYFDLDAW